MGFFTCALISRAKPWCIINKRNTSIQSMDNESPVGMSHHASPSRQYSWMSSAYIVKWVLMSTFRDFTSVHTSEKRNTIGATLGKDVPLNKKKSQAVRKLAMCSTKSSVQHLHTKRWFKNSEKGWSTTNCLEVNNCLRSHVSHETYLDDNKRCTFLRKDIKKTDRRHSNILNVVALQFILKKSDHLTIFYSHCNSK